MSHYVLLTNTTSDYEELPSGLIGACAEMREIFSMLKKFASNDAPVLLTGESDPSVPAAHAAEYERLARARGDDVVLHTILRAAHFEVIAPWSERWPDVARPLFAFLKNIEDRSGPRQ